MAKNTTNLAEVREPGLEALARELGPAAMARFLQQLERGCGDYTAARASWLPDCDVELIAAEVRAARQRTNEKS